MSKRLDTCAGIALLYGKTDEYSDRLQVAMQLGDDDEMEYITALMVAAVCGRSDQDYKFARDKWNEEFMR